MQLAIRGQQQPCMALSLAVSVKICGLAAKPTMHALQTTTTIIDDRRHTTQHRTKDIDLNGRPKTVKWSSRLHCRFKLAY